MDLKEYFKSENYLSLATTKFGEEPTLRLSSVFVHLDLMSSIVRLVLDDEEKIKSLEFHIMNARKDLNKFISEAKL